MSMRAQLSFIPGPVPPAHLHAWDAAVAHLRHLALATDFYVRPPPRVDTFRVGEYGTAFVRPEADRLVAESVCKASHMRAAMLLAFPASEVDAPPPPDLMAAVRQSLLMGPSLLGWRASRIAEVSSIASSLSDFTAWLRLMQPAYASILPPIDLAMAGAMAEAIGWPHTTLLRSLVLGFCVVGDIPDTGLFRPVERPATAPAHTFSPASNDVYTTELAKSLAREYRSASPSQLNILKEVAASTRKELDASLVKGPYSRAQMDAHFGFGQWRPSRRFGVEQGFGDTWKVRPIDNFKANLGNAMTGTHETIHTVPFTFIATLARAVYLGARELNIDMPAVLVGLHDQLSAYRFILNATPQWMVFALFNPLTDRVEYYWLPGHIFGAVSAVLNHNAWSEFHVAIARVFFASITGHYFDDFPTVILSTERPAPSVLTSKSAKRARLTAFSGQAGVGSAHTFTGAKLAPKKHVDAAPSNIFLGVLADLILAHTHGVVSFSITPARVARLMDTIRAIRESRALSPTLAGILRGKLGFTLTHSYGRVGRAATQPLVQREHYETSSVLTEAIIHTLDFFEALLPRMPRLSVSIWPASKPPLIIYTDAASFDKEPGVVHSELAFVIIDPASPDSPPLFASAIMPMSYYAHFDPNQRKFINIAEAVALAAVPFSCPCALQGRSFIHFVDNTFALSIFVHGYASRPDCAALVNPYYLKLASLNAQPYFEWVPSKANLSDLPSRESRSPKSLIDFMDIVPDAVRVEFVYPPLFYGHHNLVELASTFGLV